MLRRFFLMVAVLSVLTVPAMGLATAKTEPELASPSEEPLKIGQANEKLSKPPPPPEPAEVAPAEPAEEPAPAPAKKPKPRVKKKPCQKSSALGSEHLDSILATACAKGPKPAQKPKGCDSSSVTLGDSGCKPKPKPCSGGISMGNGGCESKPKPKPTGCAQSLHGVALTTGKC